MNRLNISQMVNSLHGPQKQTFFNVTQVNPDDYYDSERQIANIKKAKERLNLDGKINNIVLNVHEQLKEEQSIPISLRRKAKPNKMIPKEKDKIKRQLKSKREEGGTIRNSVDSPDTIDIQNIAHMKTLGNDKFDRDNHKSAENATNYLSYENHKRIMLAERRKHELENLIREHKTLIEDRRSLEQDVFAIRHSLDDLQHRVIKSLRELNNRKTYCECHGVKAGQTCENCEEHKETL